MWTVVEDAKSPPLSWTVAKGLTIKFNPYLKSTPFPRRYDSFIKLEEFKVVYTGAPRPTPINPIPSPPHPWGASTRTPPPTKYIPIPRL